MPTSVAREHADPLQALAGAERAPPFEAIYEEHFDFVWRSLRRLGVPDAQLDDAVQDVFVVVHRRLPEFEGRSTIKTWLFGIALRVASALRRSAARRPTEPLVEDPPDEHAGLDADAQREASEAARLVHRLLDSLDDDRRAVFVLTELEEMTAPEISAALGVNLNTVYSRLRLARRDFDAALARHRARRTT
ncbi:MAG TPA: sigma-70 family RNA polymerase sigma factor [Polyangiaceae bacterium]|jgi:RNA polymerase sigma-70 factor (ECF subfamily)|nr:sigma-70 family RNA polymerase sigma factor [Polyangiaceae bacterium]